MRDMSVARPVGGGAVAALLLLGVYVSVVTGPSGWEPAVSPLAEFWPFIVALAAGFGVQIGLYLRLRRLTRHGAGRTVVAASGGTSAAAMVSCCTHYLANVVPVLGATGVVALVAQYQTEFFWLGLVFNAAGTVYVGGKLPQASHHMAEMGGHP